METTTQQYVEEYIFKVKYNMDKVIEEFQQTINNEDLKKKMLVKICNNRKLTISEYTFDEEYKGENYRVRHFNYGTPFGVIRINQNVPLTKTHFTIDDPKLYFVYNRRFYSPSPKPIEILNNLTMPFLIDCCKMNQIKMKGCYRKKDLIRLLMKI
jgi:hypothetical protein